MLRLPKQTQSRKALKRCSSGQHRVAQKQNGGTGEVEEGKEEIPVTKRENGQLLKPGVHFSLSKIAIFELSPGPVFHHQTRVPFSHSMLGKRSEHPLCAPLCSKSWLLEQSEQTKVSAGRNTAKL